MESNKIQDIATALADENIKRLLELLVDLVLTHGKIIPEELTDELKNQSFDDRFRYFHKMVYYAIEWHKVGSSPSKLKKLMNEAMADLDGTDDSMGKRSAMLMFKDYLKYKKQIDSYIDRA